MKTLTLILFCLFVSKFVIAQETGGPYTTDENTVLLMHFDGDATNSSGIGNNGLTHGSGVSYEAGIHGQALRLDNSTADKQSWIEVPFYDELNITEEFSIECWFKINSWGEDHTYTPILFRKGEAWSADYSAGLGALENTLWATLNCENDEYNRGFDTGTLPKVINKNEWYHMSLTLKPQKAPKYWMYMDLLIRDENYNEIFASTGFGPTPPFNSNEKLFIGFGNNDNSYFDGWIDELRICNKKLAYRDDIIAEINTDEFKDSVPQMLRDRWTTYYPPIINYFPIDTVTGEKYKGNSCGMTIMIRLLHYWEHPRFPSGNIDYWFGPVHWQADLDNTEYLFDLMPDKFGPNPTEEEYGPSALFAKQVSAVTRIYYDAMSSMPQFLEEYFHYKKGMKLYFRHQFTKEEWIKIFKNELSHGRPIMAAGLEEVFDEGGAAGHYYIVDGYNSEDKFHSDESFGEVDFWVDIDSFPYGKFQSIIIGAEPDWNGKTLTLDYPKGSEYIQKQTQKEIKWTSSNINTVLLEYSTDAGKNWQTIAENVDASIGKYLWTIPETVSEEYKVRVSDTLDGNIYRRCNTFNVFDKQEITFNYPQNNTYFQSGTKQPVYWNSEGIKAFKLEYSTGESWKTLCDSITSAENLQSFTMPNLTHNSVQLKATNLANDSVFFKSESFRIMEEGLVGGVYKNDENTMLLMHFEEAVSNEANNTVIPEERSVEYKIYDENYDLHLGKAFRVNNTNDAEWHCLRIGHTEELDLGNNWTIETWVKYNEIGTEKTEYPLILEKGESFGIWLDGNGNGFGGYARFNDQSEAGFFQNQKLEKGKWYHVAITGNANKRKVSFYVHNEHRKLIFEDSRDFPSGNDGILNHSENDLFIGGVDGGSNIQFDGWIDELRITEKSIDYSEMVTNISETQIPLRFTCYPNPLNQQSVATFHLNNNEKVDLSIFDLNGRKIFTILNRKLNAGTHKVPLSNSLPTSGIYFCKLQTSEGISTLKLINR
ncbi:LamG-like jellyroll fold domain-containing protein [uncultured Draconibacterium sp.]|uniref:LamG-like jellyroll fold domain-containing protein n=1 Tax=uncultured Draconibacterium sp. TaxID=1573823 RepID=UPI002AA8B20F|nr:LamG-like jellyroll fold domain-containing protein [uncultured Draconibacterium sp.]